MKTLRNAAIGETVKVVKLYGEGAVKRRIMDMGITKGGRRRRTAGRCTKRPAVLLRKSGGAVFHPYGAALSPNYSTPIISASALRRLSS